MKGLLVESTDVRRLTERAERISSEWFEPKDEMNLLFPPTLSLASTRLRMDPVVDTGFDEGVNNDLINPVQPHTLESDKFPSDAPPPELYPKGATGQLEGAAPVPGSTEVNELPVPPASFMMQQQEDKMKDDQEEEEVEGDDLFGDGADDDDDDDE